MISQQVLTSPDLKGETMLSEIQELILQKMKDRIRKGIKLPVKTKNLAKSMGYDRNVLAKELNGLRDRSLVRWHNPKQNEDKPFCGWVLTPRMTLSCMGNIPS